MSKLVMDLQSLFFEPVTPPALKCNSRIPIAYAILFTHVLLVEVSHSGIHQSAKALLSM